MEPPPSVQTNPAVWKIALGNQYLFFFPDRILIYQDSKVGAARYGGLALTLNKLAFVESDGVPSGSHVIATNLALREQGRWARSSLFE